MERGRIRGERDRGGRKEGKRKINESFATNLLHCSF